MDGHRAALAAQYRAALDGGADPATVTAWISEAAAQERAARLELQDLTTQAPAPLSADEALAVVGWLGGMPGLLQQAGQDDRAALYAALSVSATYDPTTRSAELTVAIRRGAKTCRRGDSSACAARFPSRGRSRWRRESALESYG